MKNIPFLLLASFSLLTSACGDTGDGSEVASATTGQASAGSTESSTSDATEDPTNDPTGNPTGDPTEDPTDESAGDPTGDDDSSTTGSEGEAVCKYSCAEDEDCRTNGADSGLTCSDNGNCIIACAEDAECIALFSGWLAMACTTNDECGAGPCIDLGDGGGCATEPSDFFACEDAMLAEVEATDIEGNAVTVCGNAGATCTDLNGDITCTLDTEPTSCDEVGCPDGLSCEGDGLCHCTADADCETAGFGDTCNADTLCIATCADASECEFPFDGGEVDCAPL